MTRADHAGLAVDVPGLKLASTLNGSHRSWHVPARERKSQRAAVAWALVGRTRPALPVVATITRVGPRTLDDDNLAAAAKSVRDEVALWLGVNDNDPRVTWAYDQARGSYAVRVTIAPRRP